MTPSQTTRSAHKTALSDVDLRLLRVFSEIVRCNGFTAAQANLGMTQATISVHMRNLEERLNVRLCERGRSGFILTNEGKQIHSAVLDLFGSIERFQGAVGDVQGELTGRLLFGTVDAMATNTKLNLHAAIGHFARRAPKVQLDIDIAAPQALSQGIMNGRYQLVLMPAQPFAPQNRATDVFLETQNLYCGQGHPLFAVPDIDLTPEVLAGQSFAGRSYMPEATICGVDFCWGAVTAHMEGTLLLLLSGAYVGFLPDHYANALVHDRKLRVLAPDRINFKDRFQIVHSRERPTLAATLLADAISKTGHAG
ncbi:MAG: LysR family transcriptional regulator [Paracoccaceae bacterium]